MGGIREIRVLRDLGLKGKPFGDRAAGVDDVPDLMALMSRRAAISVGRVSDAGNIACGEARVAADTTGHGTPSREPRCVAAPDLLPS